MKAQINGLLSLKPKYRLNTRGHNSNVTHIYVSEITLQTQYTFLYCQFHKVNRDYCQSSIRQDTSDLSEIWYGYQYTILALWDTEPRIRNSRSFSTI